MPYFHCISRWPHYYVYPGQALSYKVGMQKILELREQAKDALGQGFDIRRFHDVALKNGAMPLQILEEVMNQDIEKTSGG